MVGSRTSTSETLDMKIFLEWGGAALVHDPSPNAAKHFSVFFAIRRLSKRQHQDKERRLLRLRVMKDESLFVGKNA